MLEQLEEFLLSNQVGVYLDKNILFDSEIQLGQMWFKSQYFADFNAGIPYMFYIISIFRIHISPLHYCMLS